MQMQELTIFDFMEDGDQYKPIKSTDWRWTFADYPTQKNGLTVFICFACGGGSTMGYKLAGCDVLGCCEIDPKMNEIYIKNHHPKYNFLMDIRKFNETPDEELPEELFDLDILDGSPPCTTFSMAGDREESWGKKKKFREGQAEQTLHRVFFIALRDDIQVDLKRLDMSFNYEPIPYGVIKEGRGRPVNEETQTYRVLCQATPADLRVADVFKRIGEKERCFNSKIAWEENVLQTLTANLEYNRGVEKERITELDIIHAQTFPEDYDFMSGGWNDVAYICGMSVPPIMIKRIVTRLIESGVFEQ